MVKYKMQMDLYTVVYLVTNIFNIAAIHQFMHIFYEKRRTPLAVAIASYAGYFLLISVVYLTINIPILTLCTNFLLFVLITYNYETTLKKSILSSFYILIFAFIPEILIGVLTGYFQFSFFEVGSYSSVFGVVSMRLFTYLEAIVLRNFKGVRNNEPMGNVIWFSLIFIPLTTLFLRIVVLNSENLTQIRALWAIILILAINTIAFYFYDALAGSYKKAMQAEKLKTENEMYYKQCELMKNSIAYTQQFRHDMKHQFAVMRDLLDSDNHEALKKHLDSLSQTFQRRAVFCTTGNIAIDSIVNYKLQQLMDIHAEIETEIAVPSDLKLEISDAISCIGNLLDNAIQALEQVDEKYLYLKIVYTEGRLMIRVKNRYAHEIRYENGEIQTTKGDRKEHGFGLKSVRTIAEQYHGTVKVNHNDKFFIVDLLLYVA